MNLLLNNTYDKTSKNKNIIPFSVFMAVAVVIIIKQQALREAMDASIKMCLSSIIPSIFPFMILSDYLICNFTLKNSFVISKSFQRLFSISSVGLLPFLIGNICGFPLGAKMVTELFDKGYINQDEFDTLLPLCSNPSVAFVISGVGIGMRGSIKEGVILYITIAISTIIAGVIWKNKNSASHFNGFFKYETFSLADAIKNSALSCIYVSAYIIFFSLLIAIFRSLNIATPLILFLASFLEIGTATSLISKSNIGWLSIPLTAFSLAFSGVSVYMQTLCFAHEGRCKNYIKIKFTEGLIAFIIAATLSYFFF